MCIRVCAKCLQRVNGDVLSVYRCTNFLTSTTCAKKYTHGTVPAFRKLQKYAIQTFVGSSLPPELNTYLFSEFANRTLCEFKSQKSNS